MQPTQCSRSVQVNTRLGHHIPRDLEYEKGRRKVANELKDASKGELITLMKAADTDDRLGVLVCWHKTSVSMQKPRLPCSFVQSPLLLLEILNSKPRVGFAFNGVYLQIKAIVDYGSPFSLAYHPRISKLSKMWTSLKLFEARVTTHFCKGECFHIREWRCNSSRSVTSSI